MGSDTRKLRTAILISGRGSNMVAIAEAAQADDYPAEIVGVLSNRPDAKGLERAKALGITTAIIDHKGFKGRRAFEVALHEQLIEMKVELVCCAGFMRILTPEFVNKWTGRILNIHPSLLPKYKGLNTHQRAIDAGEKEAGVSVHWVSEELDGGSVIAQKSVKIGKNDTAETLADRILPLELALYPAVIREIAPKIIHNKLVY
jgi:formyltetrahydrofolate-dependent phosphoribosylglycinamide formyltransferase